MAKGMDYRRCTRKNWGQKEAMSARMREADTRTAGVLRVEAEIRAEKRAKINTEELTDTIMAIINNKKEIVK